MGIIPRPQNLEINDSYRATIGTKLSQVMYLVVKGEGPYFTPFPLIDWSNECHGDNTSNRPLFLSRKRICISSKVLQPEQILPSSFAMKGSVGHQACVLHCKLHPLPPRSTSSIPPILFSFSLQASATSTIMPFRHAPTFVLRRLTTLDPFFPLHLYPFSAFNNHSFPLPRLEAHSKTPI